MLQNTKYIPDGPTDIIQLFGVLGVSLTWIAIMDRRGRSDVSGVDSGGVGVMGEAVAENMRGEYSTGFILIVMMLR